MNSDISQKYSITPFFQAFGETLKSRIGQKDTPTILVQGGFGKHNTGDDTLLLVANREIKKHYPNANIFALCHNPEFLKEDYGIEGIKFKSFKTIKYLFKADALVVPAGGLTNNIDFNSKIRSLFNPRGKFVLLALLITILRRKCSVVFGVGIHEIPDFIVGILLKITIPRVSLIGVRDKYTCKYLEKIGRKDYYFFHDPVISYESPENQSWEDYKKSKLPDFTFYKYIVLNFRLVKDSASTEKAVEELTKYLLYFQKEYKDYGVVFLPFSIHPSFPLENDLNAFKRLTDALKEKSDLSNIYVIDRYQTADDVRMIASHAELLILTRHHAPVITYQCAIPTIVVSYNLKCREFAELGEYKYIVDYDKLTFEYLKDITTEIIH